MTKLSVEILLIEDNPSDIKLALHAFKIHHLSSQVYVVRDGAEALEFLFCTDRYAERRIEENPKLILLDLNLPLIDGIEVLRQLKSDLRTRHIPIVVMSTSNKESDLVQSYKLGANSYIVKPLDFAQFSEVVRQLGACWLMLNHVPPVKG